MVTALLRGKALAPMARERSTMTLQAVFCCGSILMERSWYRLMLLPQRVPICYNEVAVCDEETLSCQAIIPQSALKHKALRFTIGCCHRPFACTGTGSSASLVLCSLPMRDLQPRTGVGHRSHVPGTRYTCLSGFEYGTWGNGSVQIDSIGKLRLGSRLRLRFRVEARVRGGCVSAMNSPTSIVPQGSACDNHDFHESWT